MGEKEALEWRGISFGEQDILYHQLLTGRKMGKQGFFSSGEKPAASEDAWLGTQAGTAKCKCKYSDPFEL